MEQDKNDKDKRKILKPRPYQEELLEIAKKRNTILFLPTGSGKTFIAVLLIRELGASLEKKFTEGGKRTFYLVNTVALVSQQKDAIKDNTPFNVGHYSGDMGVDFWARDRWREELDAHQILVMTAQILLDMLHHCFIQLDQINLIILDECHRAVKESPMRQIMMLFENYNGVQPRVLGLTATLLNSNCKPHDVEKEIRALEVTMRSKVATVDSLHEVMNYSTKPMETILPYNPTEDNVRANNCEDVYTYVLDIIRVTQNSIQDCKIEDDSAPLPPESPPNAFLMRSQTPKWKKLLKNALVDLQVHVEMLGIYGAFKATLAHYVQLERLRRKCEETPQVEAVVAYVNTVVLKIRKLLDDAMEGYDVNTRLFRFSSSKVLTLFEILKDFKPSEFEDVSEDGSAGKRKLCGIIFVERRFTAKILCHILRDLIKIKDFSFIKPNFLVGFQNNPNNDTREGSHEKKIQSDILRSFDGKDDDKRVDVNLLVASDVIEEGVDIQQCNLVVKFDMPKTYRSYVQSKGRARDRSGKFFLLIPRDEIRLFQGKRGTYESISTIMKNLLIGQNETRADPEEDEEMDDEDNYPPYYPFGENGPCITMLSAISLVNRYCNTLPQDKFTELTPYWWLSKPQPVHDLMASLSCGDLKAGQIKAFLQFPINSKVRGFIEGQYMPNKKLAKRSVALEACKQLHLEDELNERLLPKGSETQELYDERLFPNWRVEKGEPAPGTYKKRRSYIKRVPEVLCSCRPMSKKVSYLHVILQQPVYERPPDEDTKNSGFYDVLAGNSSYAILTSKELPAMCDFPVFLKVGEVEVSVRSAAQIILTDDQIRKLILFHRMLFGDLLALGNKFLTVDVENKENSFLIVPVSLGTENCIIDWKVVNGHQKLPPVQKVPAQDRQEMLVTQEYEHAVVTPWYRRSFDGKDQNYVVTRICTEMNPLSAFPTGAAKNFAAHFNMRYNVQVQDLQQPLLEVKTIQPSLYCLRPRSATLGLSSKRKKAKGDPDEHIEYLIPELCTLRTMPSTFWVKAIMLPSILHRIKYILMAEELRLRIQEEAGFRPISPGVWQPLEYDVHVLKETKAFEAQDPSFASSSVNVQLRPVTRPSTTLELEVCDPDRQIDELTLDDIEDYEDYVNEKLPTRRLEDEELDEDFYASRNAPVPVNQGESYQQREILQALTAATAADIINLERLETLGDSFLKFASSLFLFLQFGRHDEGKLTCIKGKIIGNRNLFYSGEKKGVPKMIKINDFSPNNWVPPGFCVPRKIQAALFDLDVSPAILSEFEIPEDERHSGHILAQTWENFKNKLCENCDKKPDSSPVENFISQQTVRDKSIADCVEAIIGAYYNSYGERGAFKVLGWFGILLPDEVEKLLQRGPPPAIFAEQPGEVATAMQKVNHFLKGTRQLERSLGYNFDDRSYLLQALTHPSFTPNRVTDCYQRLEFIGDAIIDFLITRHIYHHSGARLSPGQLTDLRSALVNNITFASLTVRNGFHKYILHNSPKLADLIRQFAQFQEANNHEITEECLLLSEENDCFIAEDVEVPKILGDIFESLAGAIYLDAKFSLDAVWRVYYRLMHKEIEKFSKDAPKHPVRRLHEMFPTAVKFETLAVKDLKDDEKYLTKEQKEILESRGIVMMQLEIRAADGCQEFYGFGCNKKEAKQAASKCALKYYLKKQPPE